MGALADACRREKKPLQGVTEIDLKTGASLALLRQTIAYYFGISENCPRAVAQMGPTPSSRPGESGAGRNRPNDNYASPDLRREVQGWQIRKEPVRLEPDPGDGDGDLPTLPGVCPMVPAEPTGRQPAARLR